GPGTPLNSAGVNTKARTASRARSSKAGPADWVTSASVTLPSAEIKRLITTSTWRGSSISDSGYGASTNSTSCGALVSLTDSTSCALALKEANRQAKKKSGVAAWMRRMNDVNFQ